MARIPIQGSELYALAVRPLSTSYTDRSCMKMKVIGRSFHRRCCELHWVSSSLRALPELLHQSTYILTSVTQCMHVYLEGQLAWEASIALCCQHAISRIAGLWNIWETISKRTFMSSMATKHIPPYRALNLPLEIQNLRSAKAQAMSCVSLICWM